MFRLNRIRTSGATCGVVGLAFLAVACGSGTSDSSSATATAATHATAAAATRAPARASAGVRLVRVGVFDQPTYVTGAPGERHRLFVVERPGRIQLLVGGRRASRPFLDVSALVATGGGEQGLLSMAFAPDYARSGRFYIDYTDTSNNLRVVEYTRSARSRDSADAGSARTVLTIDHHSQTNHNGGQLQFGPDRDLYVGVGDGGSEQDPFNYGQNAGVLLGKVLRISPRRAGGYSIPKGNPFAGQRGKRAEIWAYGLRNPWRFSFDRRTGDLVIGDVGQDLQEEIDFAPNGTGAGANYGWSVFEGDRRNKPGSARHAVRPVLVKLHSAGYCAIVGGYVVRDHGLGSLYGRYLYGDNCHAAINSVKLSRGHARGDHATGLSVQALSSFGQDTLGHVYAVSLNGPVSRLSAR